MHLLMLLACAITVTPSPDYRYLVGSVPAPAGTPYRWLRNGAPWRYGTVSDLFLLHADGALEREPAAGDAEFGPGRWDTAFSGVLTYAREGNLDLREGTIEIWVALRAAPTDALYTERDRALFQYRAGADSSSVSYSRSGGLLYGGGTVAGAWQSAYGPRGSIRAWKPGEWHHIAFTYSASANRMQFYVDGLLAADTNERRYVPPPDSAETFRLGDTAFWMDAVRISSRAMDAAEIRASAQRQDPPRAGEVWLPLAEANAGDTLTLASEDCPGAAFAFGGIPLSNPDPPSTLLAPDTTSLPFSVESAAPASCGYSVKKLLDYDAMTPFDRGQGGTTHQTVIQGLSSDTKLVNDVYVRCNSDPAYALRVQYRSRGYAYPPYPRKGNLWGAGAIAQKGLEYASRIDLYLGADFTAAEIRRLRELNPHILVLTSINTVEHRGLPEDFYLHDVRGRRIEVWPGIHRLNLTKPYVAEYQARFAYQQMLDSGLMTDGCFFDNFFTSQSWLKQDMYGNPVQVDANEDGQPDAPKWLDAAWKDGVYHELETWRVLMPNALASGHLPRPVRPEFGSIFNGDSVGFMTSDVIEGKESFQKLWDVYNGWFEGGRWPVTMMIESTPQDQISYGYSYAPYNVIPRSTLEFARTWYPNMRFGLAFTLMNGGYFAHEYGDTWHGNDWWYDELDFNLGQPLGPPRRVDTGTSTVNRVDNGTFDQPLDGTWRLTLNTSAGAFALMAREEGAAHITILSAGNGTAWHVDFNQPNRSLVKGTAYDLKFRARADGSRTIALSSQKGVPDWRSYGLTGEVAISAEWSLYTVTFTANETASDARIQFFLGARTGDVWIDDVQLVEHPPDVYRRDFDNGTVLLNGSRQKQRITAGPGYSRITGDQAPRYQYIVDDASAAFSAPSEWRSVTYDSGEWKATPPFYHAWNGTCRQIDTPGGAAQWQLGIEEDDTYTVEAWWPAAPGAERWSRRVTYEVVAGGRVVASATLDQSTGGDEWHAIATVPLTAASAPLVRVRNEGEGPAIADALHVRSARRYNDGSAAANVTLQPMDGIILKRGN